MLGVKHRPGGIRHALSKRFSLDVLLLGLLLCVAAFFRLYQQGQVPPGLDFDEAFESLQAHLVLTQPGYHPIFFAGNNGVPPILIYATALAYLIFGEQMLAIRYVSALAGILTVPALYALVRMLFPLPASGEPAGEASPSANVRRFLPFVAALLLAVLPWHLAFSRRGIEVVLAPLWEILAIFFLYRGLGTGKWLHFAVSGFFWGSSFYTYQAAAFLPVLLVLLVLHLLLTQRGFLRRHARQLLLLAVVAALVLVPLLLFAYHNVSILLNRGSQTTFFLKGRGHETPWVSLADNVTKVAGLFFVGGDPFLSDNITERPPLPLPLALALVIGCLLAIRHYRRPEYGLLLIWFLWMLVPSLITQDAPSIRRTIGAIPPMLMLIALGLGWSFDFIFRLARGRGSWRLAAPRASAAALPPAAAICALLLYTVAWGYQYYFVDWGQRKELFYWFDQGLVELGRSAAATPPETRLYFTPTSDNDVINLPLVWQVRDRELTMFDGKSGTVLPPTGTRPTVYLIKVVQGDSMTLPVLQALYPTGRITSQVYDGYGRLNSLAFAVGPNTAPDLPVDQKLAANFANQLELMGAHLSAQTLGPGDTLTVTLFWRSLSGPTGASHTVFTHLLGPPDPVTGTPLLSGHDSPPLRDSYPTTRWAQGEIIVDPHSLVIPSEAPAGQYQIEVGLYTPKAGNSRLNILDTNGAARGTSVIAGSLQIR